MPPSSQRWHRTEERRVDADDEVERVRGRLRMLLAERLARGLNRLEEEEYQRLCEREWELLQAPPRLDLTAGPVDVDEQPERDTHNS